MSNLSKHILLASMCSPLFGAIRCTSVSVPNKTLGSGAKSNANVSNPLTFANDLLTKAPRYNLIAKYDLVEWYQYLFEDKILNACPNLPDPNNNHTTHASTGNSNQAEECSVSDQLFGPEINPILEALDEAHPLHLVYAMCSNQSFNFDIAALKEAPELVKEIREMVEPHDDTTVNQIQAQFLLTNPDLYNRIIHRLTQESIHKGKVFKNFPTDEQIKEKFRKRENQYGYYTHPKVEEAETAFVKAFKIARIISGCIEQNGSDELAYNHGYKMVLFFGPNEKKTQQKNMLKECAAYLKNNFAANQKRMHDAFSAVTIAENGRLVTLSKWQEMINKHGPKAMKLFAKADTIEQKLATGELTHQAPKDFTEAKRICAAIRFARASENDELAEVALGYPAFTEAHFNRSLEVLKQRKTKDKLPNKAINGEHVGHKGYWLVKLPIDDPRACLLGHITNCCQSIGGHSEPCVIDGIQRENNGFYVLLKSKNKNAQDRPMKSNGQINYDTYEIVGQGYAWMSSNGNLVFDSWENLRRGEKGDDPVIFDLLRAFARELVNERLVQRVVVGLGGGTPARYQLSSLDPSECETMLEGYRYRDSIRQAVVGNFEIDNLFQSLGIPLTMLFRELEADDYLFDRFIKALEEDRTKALDVLKDASNLDKDKFKIFLQWLSTLKICPSAWIQDMIEIIKALPIATLQTFSNTDTWGVFIDNIASKRITIGDLKDASNLDKDKFKIFLESLSTLKICPSDREQDIIKALSIVTLEMFSDTDAWDLFIVNIASKRITISDLKDATNLDRDKFKILAQALSALKVCPFGQMQDMLQIIKAFPIATLQIFSDTYAWGALLYQLNVGVITLDDLKDANNLGRDKLKIFVEALNDMMEPLLTKQIIKATLQIIKAFPIATLQIFSDTYTWGLLVDPFNRGVITLDDLKDATNLGRDKFKIFVEALKGMLGPFFTEQIKATLQIIKAFPIATLQIFSDTYTWGLLVDPFNRGVITLDDLKDAPNLGRDKFRIFLEAFFTLKVQSASRKQDMIQIIKDFPIATLQMFNHNRDWDLLLNPLASKKITIGDLKDAINLTRDKFKIFVEAFSTLKVQSASRKQDMIQIIKALSIEMLQMFNLNHDWDEYLDQFASKKITIDSLKNYDKAYKA